MRITQKQERTVHGGMGNMRPCMRMVIRERSCWWVHGTRPCMATRCCQTMHGDEALPRGHFCMATDHAWREDTHLGLRPARNSSSGSCRGMMPGSRQAVMKRKSRQRAGSKQLCGAGVRGVQSRSKYAHVIEAHARCITSYLKTMMMAWTWNMR